MQLIIVESPTKARTLSRFLGNKYRIEATFGHLRDLPKSELGVDVENNFLPKYVIARDKSKRVKELRAMVKSKDKVILATDPDREGEAIAYHMAVILSQKGSRIKDEEFSNDRFLRISFHEITQEAISLALKNPGTINFPLVNSQQARRVLDRLVGYQLSPLLWKKLSRSWLSAGRVQSVAVRLTVEREREITKFAKNEYWVIEGVFKSSNNSINAKLISKDDVDYESKHVLKLFDGSYTFTKTSIIKELQAKAIIKDLQAPFIVSVVDKKEIKRSPAPPFITSALQIEAARRFGFTSKRTMRIAQSLYEDGLITYHRTDSVNLSTKFLSAAKTFIEKNFGKKYVHYRTYATKSKVAQEAHEAIRPTNINHKIDAQSSENLFLDNEKLYDLIWKRAIASQMSDAIFDSTTVRIKSLNNYLFETQGSVIKFDGFLKVTGFNSETQVIPNVMVGQTLDLQSANQMQKFTQPPPRYSEASLIKALEEDGIGRPSTYAPTISTIQERLYVTKENLTDGKRSRYFTPTPLGILVNDFLIEHFPSLFDLPFTAKMEGELDEIAEGTRDWTTVIKEFYVPFKEKLTLIEDTVETIIVEDKKTGNKCPECKVGDEIIKEGRFGKFYACSRFPECKYTKNFLEKLDIKCPECKTGDVVIRKTKSKRVFYGCSRYPECKYASWVKPVGNNLINK
ncbi:MAG: topoisomerase protein [Candidatus Gottesmanbacteria bacterium GW2011_GWA1_34_13]|uniref:DNA topoisomerase 1 n=1 Tax=Candidatus Gottesmanbacteria bacterium GW2011_GWA1_34_13 TaxID=1618434 RepID=A0A0G0DX73_9BACT|nr:MAG: topoisomerase protein [Candidatus Gottesmanbacteria bacterium GW2011_GWA1_34_13]